MELITIKAIKLLMGQRNSSIYFYTVYKNITAAEFSATLAN